MNKQKRDEIKMTVSHTNNKEVKSENHKKLQEELEMLEKKLGVTNDGTWLKAPSGYRMGYDQVVSGTTARNTFTKATLEVDTTSPTGYRQA